MPLLPTPPDPPKKQLEAERMVLEATRSGDAWEPKLAVVFLLAEFDRLGLEAFRREKHFDRM